MGGPDSRRVAAQGALYTLQIIGPELADVANVSLRLIGTPSSIEVAGPELDGPSFVNTTADVKSILRSLRDGRSGAAIFRSSRSDVRFAIVFAPNAFGDSVSRWRATIDLRVSDWRSIWSVVVREPWLQVGCICIDDGIELSDARLSVVTFPWGETRLVVAAVRAADGALVIRENPTPSW